MMSANGERKGRNRKLETFLKRKMKPGVYGDIRWYEPVVLRRDASLAYKQVVVTGEEILLVDTPPKDITTLLCINNITAVLMVHDLPEFLEGGLRDRTTHILLRVRNEDSLRNLHQRLRRNSATSSRASSSRRGSLQSVISEEAFSESSYEVVEVNANYIQNKTPKWKKFLERRCSRDSLTFSSSDSDKINLPKRESIKSPTLRFRPPLIRGIAIYDDPEDRPRRLSYSRNHMLLPESRCSIEETSPERPNIEGLSPLLGIKGEFGSRPISPALCEVLTRVDAARTFPSNGRSATPDFPTRQNIPRSISAFENYHGPFMPVAVRSRSVLDKPLNLYSTLPRRNQSTNHVDMNEFSEEEEEVHLYTLSTSTYLFHLLHSLWMTSLLVTSPEMNSYLQLNEEGMDQTFRSLCNDLRKATSLEENCSLLLDLRQGIRKYSIVRRFFWRDTETLSLVRSLLRSYCHPRRLGLSPANEDPFEQRESELKIVILALEVIESSLIHSQGCPYKAKTFNNNFLLQELLREVLAVPEIPPPHSLTCKRFLTNFKEFSEGAWHSLPEKEGQLLEVMQEIFQTSVGTAFYMIEAIFEIGWSDISQGGTTASLNMLLRHVPLDKWLSYAMPQLLLLVQPKSRDVEAVLAREDVVLIYQFLGVLLALLKQSPRALAFCIANYSEEFRYYINESVLKRKFDSLDPLTPHAFRLAKSLSRLVLR